MSDGQLEHRIAEAIRQACLAAAQEAYESAGVSGLCEEGRWECAMGAIRALNLEAIIRAANAGAGS